MHDSSTDIDEFDEEYKSKTELKQEMLEMQAFARKLIEMSKHQRSKLPLTEELQEAMSLADKINSKSEALKRHKRFVAKLLLETDLAPIYKAIDIMANKHQQEDAKFHRLEQIRDELIANGQAMAEELIAQYDSLERQKLRQLIRQASKEVKAEKPAKYYKELFSYLKAHINE